MKKIFSLLVALSVLCTSFAASGIFSPNKNAKEVYVPLGNNLQISLNDLSTIKVKDYEKISGRHLNFFQKMSFKAGQRQLRKSIAEDGTITNKNLVNAISDTDHSVGFHIGGFALGFLLSLIGVLLAYVIGGDPAVKKNRAKWAWIGFGVWIIILILFI